MIKIEHNVETGEVTEIEMTAQEVAQFKKDQAESVARNLANEAKATSKAALLQRLGITADEAALLLS